MGKQLEKIRAAAGVSKPVPKVTTRDTKRDAADLERSPERLRLALLRSNLASDLIQYYQGNGRNLSTLQVRVGLALLNKAYPDLKAVEVDATITDNTSRRDLEARMAEQGIDIEGIWERLG